MKFALPCRVSVKDVLSSRYGDNQRPINWDRRMAGQDKVLTSEYGALVLKSDGSQSPPQPGWIIILTSGDEQGGYQWTLYGMTHVEAPVEAAVHS